MLEERTYPVRVDAAVRPAASRGLWLVKWLLLLPHYVILACLWVAFVLTSVIVFFSVLFTARYPRALFDFNVGVLRWSWRVNYYGYGALGTDRYPPFTLADVPDYPAHLDVVYPERLSRGLVLVKWWLLAIPHYIIVSLFVGGGIWLGTRGSHADGIWDTGWGAGGLVALLVLVAGIALLFSGRYPQSLYDFVLGMDRWALRVAGYAALMTDEYPPFRMDMGGRDPASLPVGPTSPPAFGSPSGSPAETGYPSAPGYPAATGGSAALARATPATAWTAGRVAALVVGALLLFGAAGAFVGGGTLAWADQHYREGSYLMTPRSEMATDRYAIASDSFRLEGSGLDWSMEEVVGSIRLEVTATDPGVPLFIGVARAEDARRYLRDVGYSELDRLGPRFGDGRSDRLRTTDHSGGAPGSPPAEAGIWVESSSGTGTQALTWRASEGDWMVVVMRADGTAGINAQARAGATVPGLPWVIAGIFVAGAVLLAVGALLVGVAVHRAQGGADRGPAATSRAGPDRTEAQ
ncbi:DUF4389 domain-containing protein [Cumulibacter manganitolerans]|uniref:DUF4389 domain-containing protein n=1 Tax=Cumulibacter manganitolerans TaxID=1884992 RepID=UPI0012966885|nr:DUF4389 domain-containing protein [Cumulibacter manganitolerans]